MFNNFNAYKARRPINIINFFCLLFFEKPRINFLGFFYFGPMAKLVYAQFLKSCPNWDAGSTPARFTLKYWNISSLL